MMMERNIFREIAEHKIPADIVYEDEQCVVFRDVQPQAPTHLLVIPKKEIRTHADLSSEDGALIGHLHLVTAAVAKKLQLSSYRLVINCESAAGQSVPHLHLHLLSGRTFSWPPG
jgi:histidine triad (HIT) family protein